MLPVVSYTVFRQPSVLSMRADVDILLHSLSSRHREQPNALKVSATLFSHLKVSKALSASSHEVLYRIHTLCCIFSPSKFAPFVPAILEQSFRPPHLLHCIFRQRWKMADLTGNNKGPSPGRGLGLLEDEVGPWHKLHHRVVKLPFSFAKWKANFCFKNEFPLAMLVQIIDIEYSTIFKNWPTKLNTKGNLDIGECWKVVWHQNFATTQSWCKYYQWMAYKHQRWAGVHCS